MFAEEVQEQFPEYSEEQIIECCKKNFEYIGISMATGDLPVIRQKYFGTFIPYPNRVKGMLKKLKERYEKGNMGDEEYFEMRTNLENYLENVEQN